jgi:hypothetical protein
MNKKICYWNKGNARIYTKKIDIVNQAIKDGFFVMEINEKSHIYNSELFQIF